MPLRPLESVVPPGGFHFMDTSSGSPVRIDGESPLDLATRVLRQRLANAKPPGDPIGEVSAYICGNWPHFCRDTDTPPPLAKQSNGSSPVASFSSRVSLWMATFVNLAQADGNPSPSAEERARVCADCPHNQDHTVGGCGPCIQSVEKLSFVWRRQRETSEDKRLGSCRITAQHNVTAVHATALPEATDAQKAQLPEKCWRRTPDTA